MFRFGKTSPSNSSAGKGRSSKAGGKEKKGRRTGFIVASVIVVILAVIVGVGYYQTQVAPFHRTIIKVGDNSINAGQFLKRCRLAGGGGNVPHRMLQTLTEELLIKQRAPRYGISVSQEEVTQRIRGIARGESESISEAEFKEWYRQRLNELQLSDSEFRDIIRTGLLRERLHKYLAEKVPTMAEQVHLHVILVDTYKEAKEVRERLKAGEDFAELARQVSLDEESKEKGGDIGWLPRGANDLFDRVAFNLDIGEVSKPVRAEKGFYLLMVSEKAVARKVEKEDMKKLKEKALEHWINQELKSAEVKYNFNSEIYHWIMWQLQKRKEKTS